MIGLYLCAWLQLSARAGIQALRRGKELILNLFTHIRCIYDSTVRSLPNNDNFRRDDIPITAETVHRKQAR